MSTFFPLEIKEVIRETPQAVSLSFNIPENLKEEFKFNAGQYITIKAKLGDEELRRAYSLCSAPNSGEFKVTVKEVEGGKFSVIANNKLNAGDILEVHPPEGKFILKPSGEARTYAAFAAGSGITPVLSIIKTVLAEEPKSRFVLTYGNKSPEETIFFKELLELQAKFPDRLFIEFVYSRTREDNSHFGRIETSTVNFVVKNKFKEHAFDAFYLCGPEEMINQVSDVLKENGVTEDKILYELFTSEDTGAIETNVEGQTELTIMVDDEETTFSMDIKETVLDAALEHDLDVPYSCQGGICSSCIARIVEGKAEMRKNQILTDEEIEEGLILTCQAQPLTPKLKVDYDDV
ncbi:ferredoxin--NADP reductase [Salegentibacter mishustinae]|uniref:Flavodoxin reductase n=1 Tax=Salegentibacter mishustinae TaxID=270918 RepID=A0A0Q9Z4C6_9FLAO|nr:ferredoxin--NADP reductase [Salegentibacter mishustinae]KRG27725.1 flavodoxin reductase [Salegentibacter mishustinae]PNW20794.1 flavodoxin reductase [Salegentibacter mishustinae]PZX64204.1 ring-1,2-phenylacetyl-CoA epoxidase subunit PaaE [Salegentibacter mishustinae]GGW90815.1 flavodoxin reductase [Salegentibacter mishustinae]